MKIELIRPEEEMIKELKEEMLERLEKKKLIRDVFIQLGMVLGSELVGVLLVLLVISMFRNPFKLGPYLWIGLGTAAGVIFISFIVLYIVSYNNMMKSIKRLKSEEAEEEIPINEFMTIFYYEIYTRYACLSFNMLEYQEIAKNYLDYHALKETLANDPSKVTLGEECIHVAFVRGNGDVDRVEIPIEERIENVLLEEPILFVDEDFEVMVKVPYVG